MTKDWVSLFKSRAGGHKRPIASCDLADLNFFDATPEQSAWRWLYESVCDVFPQVPLSDAHSLVYCARDVMRELKVLQKKHLALMNPGLRGARLTQAYDWSNLNCGPMEGSWIPKGRIIVSVELRVSR